MATQQQQPVDHPAVSIELNATDLVGAAGVMASLVAAALFKRLRTMGRQMQDLARPALLLPRDLVRARELLAQLAILTNSDRVLLGLYHNGLIDSSGFHLSRLQILAGYFQPGTENVSEYLRVVPVSAVPELRSLWASPNGMVMVRADDPALSTGCRTYLDLRSIRILVNITLRAGDTDVGVLGCHYTRGQEPRDGVFESDEVKQVLRELSRLATLRSTHQSTIGVTHLQN